MNISEIISNTKLLFFFYFIINAGFSQSNQKERMIWDTIQSVSQNYGLDTKEIFFNYTLKKSNLPYNKKLLGKYEDLKKKYYSKDNFKDRNYELVRYLRKYVGYVKYGNEVISSFSFDLNKDGKSISVKLIDLTEAITINLDHIDKSSIMYNFPIPTYEYYYTIKFSGKNCINSRTQEYFSGELQFRSNSSFKTPTTQEEKIVKKVKNLLFYQ
ncbi:hypothetical protein [Aquimarina sp. AU58]|uniref:hypothetical protein n=1 Tax=Aquimarina sp. AU58 TaxID=1874112 RepID=UPI000D658CBB|nr:hypothetical protein [Aquimarina sp. AU58]